MENAIATDERARQALAVINAVAEGSLLKQACEQHGITPQSFGRVLARLRNLAELYAQAQHINADLMVDETITIADNPLIDPAQARNMMQVRQWAASKRAPKTYGDRLDIAVTQNISINDALAEARSRLLRPVRDPQPIDDAQVVDSPRVAAPYPSDGVSDAQELPDIFS